MFYRRRLHLYRAEQPVFVTWRLYGSLPIIPVMDNGASDGKYLRITGIPAYGVPGVFTDVDDDRAHGQDERIGVKDFYDGVDFYYEFIKALAGSQ